MKTIEDIVKLFTDNFSNGHIEITHKYGANGTILSCKCCINPNENKKIYSIDYIGLDGLYSKIEDYILAYYGKDILTTDDLYKFLHERYKNYDFNVIDWINPDGRHSYFVEYGTKYWTETTEKHYNLCELVKEITKNILKTEKENNSQKNTIK